MANLGVKTLHSTPSTLGRKSERKNLETCLEPQGQPFIYGCSNWMIPNLHIENGCFTKHPFIDGCLGFQVEICHGSQSHIKTRYLEDHPI